MHRGLEPRLARWQLEQQPGELPGSEPEQEQPGQPQQQHWLPPGLRPAARLFAGWRQLNRCIAPSPTGANSTLNTWY
jgi:hypothetical protein